MRLVCGAGVPIDGWDYTGRNPRPRHAGGDVCAHGGAVRREACDPPVTEISFYDADDKPVGTIGGATGTMRMQIPSNATHMTVTFGKEADTGGAGATREHRPGP